MKVELDGSLIQSEAAFHKAIAAVLPFPPYYGQNLDALEEVVAEMLERPLLLVWKNAKASERAMPGRFRAILKVLREVEREDSASKSGERFELRLE